MGQHLDERVGHQVFGGVPVGFQAPRVPQAGGVVALVQGGEGGFRGGAAVAYPLGEFGVRRIGGGVVAVLR
ncbi:hypothetical protein ACU686_32030 [Yinghuangia aomiensis]